MPHVDPSTNDDSGLRFLVAEQGLGPALVHYFVRSRVDGEVAVAEWPPAGAFDESPVRRYVVRVPELPKRMRALMRQTPGITTFLPQGPGVAVEIGYRHPVALRACPVFDPNGIVFLRGRGDEPWALDRLPVMGDLRAFARVELRPDDRRAVALATGTSKPDQVRVPLRVMPSSSPWRNVTATWIAREHLPLLRRLAYALPHAAITRTSIAVTARGAFLRCATGIEAVPLGQFFVEIHPQLFIPAGYDVTPAVAPEVLHRALGGPPSQVLFITTAAQALGVEDSAFVPLETVLLEAQAWEPVVADAIELALKETPVDLKLTSLGGFPMSGADPPLVPPPSPAGSPAR